MKLKELLTEMLVGVYEVNLNDAESCWRVTRGGKTVRSFYFTPRDAEDKKKERINAIQFARTQHNG